MADDDNASVPALILHEARGLRRRQDERLRRLLALSTLTTATFLSVGTITVAASDGQAVTAAAIVLVVALITAGAAATIHRAASDWQDGPSLAALVASFYRNRQPAAHLQMALVGTYHLDRESNERCLRLVVRLLGAQVTFAVGGAVALLAALIGAL